MNILLVEDNLDHAELIQDLCQQGFETGYTITHSTLLHDGITNLQKHHFDIALCDLQLPDSPIADTISKLEALITDTPIVVLTSLGDEDLARSLIHKGMQDYLPKDELTPAFLNRVCTYAIERKKNQVQMEVKNDDLEAFCRSLSHDFKSPLRNLKHLIELLKSELTDHLDLNESELNIFRLIDAKHIVIEQLIDGLYEHLRADMTTATKSSVDLNQLSTDVVKQLQFDNSKTVTVHSGTLPTVYGDRAQLFILFQNIIENGVKYNNNNPRIDIDCEEIDDAFQITISDNGIGIDQEYLQKIFLPFQRLHTEKEYKGSGLGLSTAKRIVANHGGKIDVQSTEGEGTRFIFTLSSQAGSLN